MKLNDDDDNNDNNDHKNRDNLSKHKYETIQDVVNDLELMFDNCLLFNEPKSFVVKEAKRLRKLMMSTLSSLND